MIEDAQLDQMMRQQLRSRPAPPAIPALAERAIQLAQQRDVGPARAPSIAHRYQLLSTILTFVAALIIAFILFAGHSSLFALLGISASTSAQPNTYSTSDAQAFTMIVLAAAVIFFGAVLTLMQEPSLRFEFPIASGAPRHQ